MYTDRNELKEYAFYGEFYKKSEEESEDGNLLDDGEEADIVILATECDIQETNKLFNSGVITMGYTIYFPNPTTNSGNEDSEEKIPDDLKPGIRFRGSVYGLDVDGMVIGVYPTQMHGCVAYVKGTDI
jgi:hypothetical protein